MTRVSLMFAYFLVLVACDNGEPGSVVQPWLNADAVSQEEDLAEASELREIWHRRERYEASGEVPPPPVSLSRNIDPSELEFVGYANVGISPIAYSEDGMPGDTTCDDHLSASLPLAETEVWGYFINSAGETWRWRPSYPDQKMRRLRRSHSDAFLDRELDEFVPSVECADVVFDGEDEGVDGVRTIIGSDNRKLRSAYNGYSMSSPSSPWMRMGGLPPDGFTNSFNNSEGTATKVGPRHLLTAGHVVWQEGGFFPKDWWPGQDGVAEDTDTGSIKPNGYKNVVWYWIAPGWYENFKNTQDYAVLILYDNASSAQFPKFGLKEDYALAGEWTWNFGIPKVLNECADSPLDGNSSCGGSMYGHQKRVRRTEVSYIFTAHDLQGGHSGGPLYKYNGGNRQIVGIVKSDYSSVENRSLRIRGPVFDSIVAVMDAWPSSYCVDYGWSGVGCQ